jgi:8-oxo-dGTP pyrophosphatase MutT (NUDIX family)
MLSFFATTVPVYEPFMAVCTNRIGCYLSPSHPCTSIIPILPDGRIVLIRRRDNGRWALPGGIVDWGEDIPTTVRRELAEETGLELVKFAGWLEFTRHQTEIREFIRFVS